MTPERWAQVDQLFHAALEREPSQRSNFLAQVCEGDELLRSELESLIASHKEAENFIEIPASDVAAELLASGQDKLALGQTIGRYEILTLLGSGGMGEVYLARDKSLGRQIALKLLPAQFTMNADRVRRFEREARAASALNHPNILTIYEIGQFDSTHFIATEFIDGVTLRERLADRPLKLDEALDVATQVAFALAAAHTAGIVHRDIKPDNVMLRSDGFVKVLDFGLAKLLPRETSTVAAEAPTKSVARTNPGMVMGTVQYMSPEQARGLEVDARTDIWSLGVVLYEMVTGKVPFAGATSVDLIVSILDREPLPLSRYLPDLPAELDRIVSKALRKDREERYQVVKDLFLDLKSLRRELEFAARLQHSAQPESSGEIGRRDVTGEAVPDVGKQTKEVRTASATSDGELPSRKRLLWRVGVVVGLVLLAGGAWYVSRLMTKPGPPQPALTAIPLTTDPGYEGMPSLSPDGSHVAFGSFGEKLDNLDIYVKLIGGGPPLRLTSDLAVDKYPAWSPDGRSIAFIRERVDKQEVLLIPALGGQERKLAQIAPDLTWDLSMVPPYLSWSPDSKYLVTVDRASPGESTGLFVLSVATGEKRRLTTSPAPALGDTNPAVSPDGRMLAFVRLISTGHPHLYVLPLSEDCRSTGEARRLELPQPWVESPAWTADGREIVCVAGASYAGGMLWRVSVSDSEKPKPLGSLGETSYQPTISRQGNRFVYQVRTMESDIWRAEVSGRDRSRPAVKLIASTRADFNAHYSPDGSQVAFSSYRSGNSEIWVCNGDGSNPVQLTSLETSGSPRWFPDGRHIVFDSQTEGQLEIYVIDTDTRVPRRLTSDPSDDIIPSVSHDGKWIYFASTRTGRWEVWRLPAEGGQAVQVTHEGGAIPVESPDGKVVYYQKTLSDSDVWQIPVTGGEEMRVLGPVGQTQFTVVADGIYFIEPAPPGYAVWIRRNSLKFFSFAKGTVEKVFDIKYWPQLGLSVSPDGRYILFTQMDPFVQDLMLVENFR